MNGASVSLHCGRRQKRTRRLIHKRHELVRKAWHRTTDADAANVGTSANPAHPSTLSNIALNHWTPASQLHNAKRRPVLLRKLRLLVEAAAVTTFMHGIAKKPRWPQSLIERNHGRTPGSHVEQIQKCLHEIIGLHRTPRHAHDGNLRLSISISIPGSREDPYILWDCLPWHECRRK